MRTNIDLDNRLVRRGLRLTHLPTKRALVNKALEELVERFERRDLTRYYGKKIWRGDLSRLRESRF